MPAGEPDPPHNCTISNQTSSFLEVDCEQGFESNVSSASPHFVVDGLLPGSQLIISLYAANGKGKSTNLVFEVRHTFDHIYIYIDRKMKNTLSCTLERNCKWINPLSETSRLYPL